MTAFPNLGVFVWCHEENALSKLLLFHFLPKNS
jgi:hypothetical protein